MKWGQKCVALAVWVRQVCFWSDCWCISVDWAVVYINQSTLSAAGIVSLSLLHWTTVCLVQKWLAHWSVVWHQPPVNRDTSCFASTLSVTQSSGGGLHCVGMLLNQFTFHTADWCSQLMHSMKWLLCNKIRVCHWWCHSSPNSYNIVKSLLCACGCVLCRYSNR